MRVDFQKFVRFCQLEKCIIFSFYLIFFTSCGTQELTDRLDERIIKPNWLKVDKDFAFRGKDDEFLIHPFYDVQNELNQESEIRYITLTPENSPYEYNLDILSGALYKVRNYCPTKDIWDNYSGKIEKPNFIMGAVPRYYNEIGELQKIIVFKSSDIIGKFEHSISHFHKAKVLGSLTIEKCESFPCGLRERWKKTQILVGVNTNDPKFSKIQNLQELKKTVDWDYLKAFLVNMNGSHQVGDKYYPAYRLNEEFNLSDTVKYFTKNSKTFDIIVEMRKRDACINLYKEMWGKIKNIRELENRQQEEFLKFFKEFYLKDAQSYFECQKYARPANINEDPERHWLFSFISAFNFLERSGLYYSCYEKGWAYNPKVDDNKFYIDQNKEIHRCRARDFEKSFDQAINGMSLLRNQTNRFFHYIEYDSAIGGSHQKLYSWILDDVKRIPCEKDVVSADFFPQDVVWQPFKEDEEKTIH